MQIVKNIKSDVILKNKKYFNIKPYSSMLRECQQMWTQYPLHNHFINRLP